ncbi:hypothetical protein AN958_09045 [Leucoagaricus sp. SymC.cos]|nr:hypothetical protein AN958_09045 [Leucoagaricus sp. SymC.cos]
MEEQNAASATPDVEKSSQNPRVSDYSLKGDPSESAVDEPPRIKGRVWWKVDRYILPVTILIYLLSWLDRTNIGNARVAGMQSDLRLSATEYSMALTVTFIIALLYACIALAGAFSGLLATAISKMDGIGNRPAWSWIFILEGLITIIFGIFCFWILPNGPETAWFLTKEEKEYVIWKLRESKVTSDEEEEEEGFSWREVWETFKLPHIWILAVNTFLGSPIVLSLVYFAPSIVLSLGFSPIRTQLMSVPPFAAAFIVTILAAILADKYRARGITVFISSLFSIAGYILYLRSTEKWTLYGSLFLILSGGSAMAPAHTTWQANNTSPHIRRATGVALLIMMANGSGVLAIWLYGGTLSSPPRYTKAMTVMLIFACLVEVGVVLNMWWLGRENKRKRRVRERSGMSREDEPKGLGDRSAWFEYIL